MANSFLFNAPSGVVGDVTRADQSNVEPIMQGSQFAAYGAPVKLNGSGQAIPLLARKLKQIFKVF